MPIVEQIRSIDPADTDWSDLAPIGRAIGKRRIVLLGEASHGDGASFAAKIRLIRYLHDVHGFDVLAFESGMYEMDAAERRIAGGESPGAVLQNAIFPLWAQADQMQPLFDWLDTIRRAKGRAMALAGIDFQLTGKLADGLPATLRDTGRRLNAATSFDMLADAVAKVRATKMKAASEFDPAAIEAARAAAIRSLERSHVPDRIWLRQLTEGVGRFLLFAHGMARQNPALLNSRDARMADNLRYLADVRYPGRKIVVWGATSHFLRQRAGFVNDGAADMVPAGQHLAHTYRNNLYSLALTSSGGQIGRWSTKTVSPLPPVPVESLEGAFAATGRAYGFAKVPRDWVGTSVMLGHAPMRGPWGRAVDGVLLIREQRAATYPAGTP